MKMQNLKVIRTAAGLSQMRLAQKAAVSRFRICMAESGYLELRPEEVSAITNTVRTEMEKTAREASELVARMASV
jgi:predicted transcriptional regulator